MTKHALILSFIMLLYEYLYIYLHGDWHHLAVYNNADSVSAAQWVWRSLGIYSLYLKNHFICYFIID